LQKLRHGGLPAGTPPAGGSAKAPGLVAGWAAPPTLSAHTRWPLWAIALNK